MLLELSVLSYHRLSPRQVAVKRFDKTGGTLGRSEQADWYLPDPERVVSGVHAQISYHSGQFSITDKSTNGLFINRSVDALGPQERYVLKHGDVLCLGDYEIQVALIEAMPLSEPVPAATKGGEELKPALAAVSPTADRGLRIADIAAAPVTADNSSESRGSASLRQVNTAAPHALSQEFELDDHFLSPSALIPDDWQSDWPSAATDRVEQRSPLKTTDHITASKKNNVNQQVQPLTDTEAQACLHAFLHGLGVSEANQQAQASPQWWEQLGQALQQSLQGVIAVMRERSEVKSRLRVNQTTFQQRENNPLKFSANIDDAFHNLFNRPGSSFMPARQAIAEAFADISSHESAIIAGANGAMTGLLTQLAPDKIAETDFGQSFVDKVNPAQRPARLWSRYKALHNVLATELHSKDKPSVNDDFISAYEAYLRSK
jgi:type VI secretion system FHA domain protein